MTTPTFASDKEFFDRLAGSVARDYDFSDQEYQHCFNRCFISEMLDTYVFSGVSMLEAYRKELIDYTIEQFNNRQLTPFTIGVFSTMCEAHELERSVKASHAYPKHYP